MGTAVDCRSDTTYAERPVALIWDGLRREVRCILSRSRTPDGSRFRIQTTDGLILDLFYNVQADKWDIAPALEAE